MKIKDLILEVTIPCGDCFRWAFKFIIKDNNSKNILVHADIKDIWSGKVFPHAWVENGRIVKDWQTMVAGSSKYAGKGWPQKEFYAAFTPRNIIKYKESEAIELSVKNKHFGPWK